MNTDGLSYQTYVLYHKDPVKGFCLDGLGARYAAYTRFENRAHYIPVIYNTPFPLSDTLIEGSEIYILDFSYSREILEHVNSLAKKLVVLDHHKTAKDALKDLDYAEFDMWSSGCVMAWRYFNPGKSCPQILEHICENDLRRYKLPYTREIIHGLIYKLNEVSNDRKRVDIIESYVYRVSELHKARNMTELYEIGKIIRSAVSNRHKEIIGQDKVAICHFQGHRVGLYNCNQDVSEMGEAICDSAVLNVDFAMLYSVVANDRPNHNSRHDVVFELRSKKHEEGTNIDVGEIAKSMGGGGHENAAGFKLPLSDGLELVRRLLLFNKPENGLC